MSEGEILFFGIGGFSYGDQSISIRAHADGGYIAHCRKAYSSDDVEEREEALEANRVDEFMHLAEQLGVFDWEARYMKSPMDGSDWNLTVNYGPHRGFASRGYSAQPANFDTFLGLLRSLGF